MEFVKSLFYQVNYLPPVEATQENLEAWHTSNQEVQNFVSQQFEDGELMRAFSEPLTLNPEKYGPIGDQFTKKGWKVLSEKPDGVEFKPYYSVLEHEKLPGWIIKHAGKRYPDWQSQGGAPQPLSGDFLQLDQNCSLLRIAMAERLRQACLDEPKQLKGVVIPEKHLVELSPGRLQDKSLPLDQKFLIIAQKVDCLSTDETVDAIDAMSQEEQVALADRLVYLVEKGLADASFANIRLGKDEDEIDGVRRVYVVDTEPSNVMVLDKGWWNNQLAFQSSVEQAGRLGTVALRFLAVGVKGKEWHKDARAPHFIGRIKEHIERQSHNKYSPTKVSLYVLSVLALTMIYNKKTLGPKLKPYLEKYADTPVYNKLSNLEIGKKTYYVAVLSPLEIGLAKAFAYYVCMGIFIFKAALLQQDNTLSPEEKTDENLKNPWMLRAARIQGQARQQMTEQQLLQLMAMQGAL